jgi:ribosome-associated translation inhibitor RaiA
MQHKNEINDPNCSQPLATNLSIMGTDTETERELKAHIYQQLVELRPLLAPDSQIVVVIQTKSDQEHAFNFTLVTTLGDYRLESEGDSSDMYEAFTIAKQQMLQLLDELLESGDNSERDQWIQSFMNREPLQLH